MIHTAELTTAITKKEYDYLRKLSNAKGKVYRLSQKGITEIEPLKIVKDYEYYFCKIIINLNRIANNGERTATLFTGEKEKLKQLYNNFESFMKSVLPYRASLNGWEVIRIDYAIDIKTPYCREYIELLQRGNKPNRLKIDSKDKHKAEIDKNHYRGSVRYQCKGYTISIYDKYKERLDKGATPEYASESENILRIEIQCKRGKIDYISRKNGIYRQTINNLSTIPLEQQNIIKKALKGIECGGEYFTLKTALQTVEISNKKATTIGELTRLLQIINQYKSVRKARAKYKNKERFDRLLIHLRELNINPVTIPKAWKIYSLPPITDLIDKSF